MKKSEKYRLAMCAVLENSYLTTTDKLEILDVLMDDRRTALFTEKRGETENESV